MKRNELDFLLTELLPVETSHMFTYTYFYQFLLNKKEVMKEIEQKLLKSKYSKTPIFNKGWHASPLKYFVNKGNNDLREISILNPFSAVEVFLFVRLYSNEILDTLNKESGSFSLRSHKKNNDLFYKSSKGGIVEYEDTKEKKDKFTKALESSGIYFKLEPYSTLGHFYNSEYWFKLNSQFKYFAKIDYKDCFGSIYTHTFKWIISHNTIDSRGFTNNNLYSVLDRLLQHLNNSISNGVIVGPEFSRMVAEILLQHVDYEVYNNLIELNLKQEVDFNICRYVDDIYIFSNEESIIEDIITSYKDNASKYQLKLNELKSVTGKLPFVWNDWKGSTKSFLTILMTRSFYSDEDIEVSYLIKGRNFVNYRNLASLKEELQNLLSLFPENREKIISYIYSALFNKLRKNKKEKLFRKNATTLEVEKVLEFIFYLYSFAPTFRNTRKLICIEYLFREELDQDLLKPLLQKTVKKYEHIFLYANIADIIDLLPVFSNNDIELSILAEEHIWSTIYKHENPLLVASFLVYSKYNKKYFRKIKNDLDQLIKKNLKIITGQKDILLYKELWWLFIYIDCPYLEPGAKTLLQEKMNYLKNSNNHLNHKILNILFDFLSENNGSNKFMEWDIESYDIVEDITYFTYERTLFRNNEKDLYSFEY
ncbi:hypothetical protein GJU40_14630 [Bacillus lacus]|uniref:Reverse transcriptase domain-containing protein n=1 Tax=Metabacillus lacus TaxID=1983721 RepID=A0A7X2J0V1_9BACI|nr:RNA-directed DNA polymerase [Metabacillus lacus]MRX73382.1 hypothetical protein [Metabacillus lacus]